MSWNDYNDANGKKTIMYYVPTNAAQQPTLKLAGFDLDGTLIWSDKGEMFAGTQAGWVFPTEDTPDKMKQLVKDGYTICLFSNRKGAPWMHAGVKSRIKILFQRLGFEFLAFLSVKTDNNRKPEIGMYNFMCQLLGVTTVTADSFYCGDAVGPTGTLPWYKWSVADIGFAKNSGLPFKEPRDIFGDYPPPPLKSLTQLIVTCGQVGSGWDIFYHAYSPSNPVTIPGATTEEDKYLYVYDNEHMMDALTVDLSNPKNVIMICGSNPRIYDRQSIVQQLNVSKEKVTIYWYSRPCHFDLKKDILEVYINTFQHPRSDGYDWVQAN
jgi:DNA 3'-phosphatase